VSSRRKRPPEPEQIPAFNPLDYANLTKNVVDELMRQGPFTLPLERRFAGAGVYALFYVGDDPEYAAERSEGATHPIYVGKAVPRGARKGVLTGGAVGTNLYDRLAEHASSIEATGDLKASDFLARYLVVEPLWIVMAEVFLITNFKPLWNLQLDGFGNHDPGSGRHQGEISWWDARHPGRAWSAFLRPTKTQEQAKERIREYHRIKAADPVALERLAEEAAEEESKED
jgi:hypothetical protein